MTYLSMTTITPYEGPIETLRFTRETSPRRSWRFGLYADIAGRKWDVYGFVGNHVLARPYADAVAMGSYDTSTNGFNRGGTWIPYLVEEVSE